VDGLNGSKDGTGWGQRLRRLGKGVNDWRRSSGAAQNDGRGTDCRQNRTCPGGSVRPDSSRNPPTRAIRSARELTPE